MEVPSIEEFEEIKEISVAEMEKMVADLRELKHTLNEAKAVEKTARTAYLGQEKRVMEALTQIGKDSYVGNEGRVTRVRKLAVRVPATIEDRLKFFSWLERTQGQEVADAYKSVNSQALNSLYNNLTEQYAERGEVLDIEGLDAPTYRESLSFRKA